LRIWKLATRLARFVYLEVRFHLLILCFPKVGETERKEDRFDNRQDNNIRKEGRKLSAAPPKSTAFFLFNIFFVAHRVLHPLL
jgi:hypothetical protein